MKPVGNLGRKIAKIHVLGILLVLFVLQFDD